MEIVPINDMKDVIKIRCIATFNKVVDTDCIGTLVQSNYGTARFFKLSRSAGSSIRQRNRR
jgi:hypothetical protein